MNEPEQQDRADEAQADVTHDASFGDNKGAVSYGIGQAIIAVVLVQLLMPYSFPYLEQVFPGEFDEPGGYNIGGTILWLSVGWTQLLYLLPLAALANLRGKTETRNGIGFVSGLLFLVTSLCNAIFLWT